MATVYKEGRDGGVCEERVAHEAGADEFETSQGPDIIDQRKVWCFLEFELAFLDKLRGRIWFDGEDRTRRTVVKFETRETDER